MILTALNTFFRWSHQRLFFPIFSLVLKALYPQLKLEVYLRNSVLEKDYFHFLYSDIDIAVITTQVDELLKTNLWCWLKISKILYPFRGEIECYHPNEWRLLVNEKKELGHWYSVTRQVRKSFWFNSPDVQAPMNKKKIRMNRNIRRKVGVGETATQEDLLAKTVHELDKADFGKIDFNGANSYFHPYFQAHIIVPADTVNRGAHMSARVAILLAACFPIDNANFEANSSLILDVHKKMPELASLQKRLAMIDKMEMIGSMRGMREAITEDKVNLYRT